jgi:uncharacterized SAM-binding protein YcdF (DUF218 family)
MSSKPSRRRRRRLLSLTLLTAVILSPAVAIVVDGLFDDVRPSDVGVVLGNKVNPDGRPSPMLQARLDEALALYRRGLFPMVMVSGGVGKEGFDEAAVMKAYLVARGVPAGAVITDNKGVNTWATAQNASALMRAKGWRSCLVVSQYFHISRSRLALRRQGVRDIRTAHARYFALRDLYSIPREVAGYRSYLMRSR